jgi:hypothetical protein
VSGSLKGAPRSADFWRRGTAAIIGRVQRGKRVVGETLTGKRNSEAEQQRADFLGLIKSIGLLLEARRCGFAQNAPAEPSG